MYSGLSFGVARLELRMQHGGVYGIGNNMMELCSERTTTLSQTITTYVVQPIAKQVSVESVLRLLFAFYTCYAKMYGYSVHVLCMT